MIYHLAHKFAEKGVRVLAVDLDPQAGLTEMFLPSSDQISHLTRNLYFGSLLGSKKLTLHEKSEYRSIPISNNIYLIPNDLEFVSAEEFLSTAWFSFNSDPNDKYPELSLFEDVIKYACEKDDIDIVLVDLGPNLSAINKTVLFMADCNLLPVSYDNLSLHSIRKTGNSLNQWEREWCNSSNYLKKMKEMDRFHSGYIILFPGSTDINLYPNSIYGAAISREYWHEVLQLNIDVGNDIHVDKMSLSLLKFNRSLYPMAIEAGKPMFHLTPADGAIGNHLNAVRQCSLEYDILAERINQACQLGLKL